MSVAPLRVTTGDLRSPQRRQLYSVGILLDIVEPEGGPGPAVFSKWSLAFCLHRSTIRRMHVLVLQTCNMTKQVKVARHRVDPLMVYHIQCSYPCFNRLERTFGTFNVMAGRPHLLRHAM